MSVSTVQRHELVGKYVDIVHQIGKTLVNQSTLREHLNVGGVDFWAASPLRESSPWMSPIFPRIDVLRGRTTPTSDTAVHASNGAAQTQIEPVSHSRVWGYWCANAVASLRNRVHRVAGDVVFVVFMPESTTPVSDNEIVGRYFGRLPDHVRSIGLTPVVVFLPTNSRPASMTKGERRTWRTMRHELVSVPITSFLTPRNVWRSWKSWRRLQRQAPSSSEVSSALPPNLGALWPQFAHDYEQSVRGTASARSALLATGFRAALKAIRGARLVVYPFEGQGWESLLEQACSNTDVPSIAYLHTIMKPWDLRAHTALRESPPRTLALHGEYDRSELQNVAGVEANVAMVQLVSVEALRYAYLAKTRVSQSRASTEHRVLIVMGSDCRNSSDQFLAITDEIRRQNKAWKLIIKSHPQCPFSVAMNHGTQVASGTLHELFAESTAVFLCGTAAPLDSYLYGLPTAALADNTGYSMNPLDPDESYFVGQTPAEVVAWLTSAMEQPQAVPSAERFFDLSPGFSKWENVVRNALASRK